MADTEARIQSEIVTWFNNTYCLAFCSPRSLILSIPNGGERSFVSASLSKSTGEYVGVADLLVIHKGKVLFVEVKTEIGKQSEKQKQFEQHILSAGFPYHLVRSLEEFKKLIAEI